jgi:hypothetical protein
MISELNQPARIASLECGLVKIPCLPEVAAGSAHSVLFFLPFFPDHVR